MAERAPTIREMEDLYHVVVATWDALGSVHGFLQESSISPDLKEQLVDAYKAAAAALDRYRWVLPGVR